MLNSHCRHCQQSKKRIEELKQNLSKDNYGMETTFYLVAELRVLTRDVEDCAENARFDKQNP